MAQKRTFTVIIDEDGEVVDVKPPDGVKPETGYLEKSPLDLSKVTRIVVPLEFIKSNPRCCVHTRDCRYWCWSC